MSGSRHLPVSHGVVQGSILGPMSFLLFTHNAPSHVNCDKIVMYANDSQFLNSSNKNDLINHKLKLEDMLSTVQIWYDQNSLKVNPAKSEMMVFGMPKRAGLGGITVNFGEAQIRPVPKMKVLGITLGPELRWESHVSAVVRKSYATLAGLARLANKLPAPVKRFIVRTLVFPHTMYCLTVWGACSRDIQRKRVQNVLNMLPKLIPLLNEANT